MYMLGMFPTRTTVLTATLDRSAGTLQVESVSGGREKRRHPFSSSKDKETEISCVSSKEEEEKISFLSPKDVKKRRRSPSLPQQGNGDLFQGKSDLLLPLQGHQGEEGDLISLKNEGRQRTIKNLLLVLKGGGEDDLLLRERLRSCRAGALQ